MLLPKVTIGITCFNASDTIRRAIASALEQNYPDFEILVVDDCSTDISVEIIQKETLNHPQVRLVRHDINKGYPEALNSIIAHANGEYIAFFDDDDDSSPDRLRKQVERIQSYQTSHHQAEHVLCYTNRHVYRPQSTAPDYSLYAIGRIAPEPCGSMVADYLLWDTGKPGYIWGMFGSCTLMVPKRTLQDIGGFDPDFRRCAEWDMAIKAAFLGAHFIAVNEPLVIQHKTLTADKSGKIPLKYALLLRDKNKDYLLGKHVYLSSRMMARSRYYGGKSKLALSKSFMVLAVLLAPRDLLIDRLLPYLRRRVSPPL